MRSPIPATTPCRRTAKRAGLPHVEIEIRQDLIADPPGQDSWAARLARLLPIADARLRELAGWSADVITSKLTSKARTTIPLPVREALRLAEGDELAYQIEGDRVVLTKVRVNPFAAFDEWSSEADTSAYASLLSQAPQPE